MNGNENAIKGDRAEKWIQWETRGDIAQKKLKRLKFPINAGLKKTNMGSFLVGKLVAQLKMMRKKRQMIYQFWFRLMSFCSKREWGIFSGDTFQYIFIAASLGVEKEFLFRFISTITNYLNSQGKKDFFGKVPNTLHIDKSIAFSRKK